MNSQQFLKGYLNKMVSIEALNVMISNSSEHEIGMHSINNVYDALTALSGKPMASNGQVNDGNGWNADFHADGYFMDGWGNRVGWETVVRNKRFNAREISMSKVEGVTFATIKEEVTQRLTLLEKAVQGFCHAEGGSTHCHNTIGYANIETGRRTNWGGMEFETVSVVDNLPKNAIYRNIGMFMTKFFPVMKWLSMTSLKGARGAYDTEYDKLHRDKLFIWADYVLASDRGFRDYDSYLESMGRGSALRIIQDGSQGPIHWENRMMDCMASPTMLASWFVLNRAITLFAYDMARNGFEYKITREELLESQLLMEQHSEGFESVNKESIIRLYNEMVSLLAKYYKKMASLEALDVMQKLIDCPVPQWLRENGYNERYNCWEVEKMFTVRNRAKDEKLRDTYLSLIKSFKVPHAENLNAFHENMAVALGVANKQALSLYQMFKRENYEIEFIGGRLVYMGD